MGIVDEDIVAVRQAADIVGLVSQYTQGKKVGRSWSGLCPFHTEKSPSFSVNPEKGVFYCFGCQKQGDAITFVREIEHLDFVGAVEWLAGRSGISLRYTSNDEGESRKKRRHLLEAMTAAVEWYHDRLLHGPDAGAARGYLRSRGFDGETVRAYGIGWAPAAWDELVTALRVSVDVLVECGLAFRNRNGKATDAFRGRLLFPIHDAEGNAVAIGGRILPGDEGPKYKNSPETALYSKSRILYGLNWHKSEIVKTGTAGEVIVCEGYTDVIGFARAGVPRAVATCGTALTEEHVKLLAKFAKRIVLAFDADAAGQGAADKFAAWEDRYELEVCVADLPPGRDPGDLAFDDPERLRAAVAPVADEGLRERGAKPYLAYRIDRILAAADLRSIEGRARAAEAAVAAVAEHPKQVVRDPYLMLLAPIVKVDHEQLRAMLHQGARPRVGGRPERDRPEPDRHRGHAGAEEEALTLLVHRPEDMAPWLDDALFVDDRHLVVYWGLLAEPDAGAALVLLQETDPGAAEVLARLAVSDSDADPSDVGALLLGAAAGRRLREVEAEARVAVDPLAYAGESAALALGIERLRDPATRAEAATTLLGLLRPNADG
ncbi:MAG: DNA primase [Acidimicrobiia bacterium]|nr:DNA primase [Acidimicrobiia bacterium]